MLSPSIDQVPCTDCATTFRPWLTRSGYLRFAALLLITFSLCLASSARAHQFSFAQGVATVHVDRVDVALEFNGEDLRHMAGFSSDEHDELTPQRLDELARQHAESIGNRLIIRSSAGHRLEGRPVNTTIRQLDNNPKNSRLLIRNVRITHELRYPFDKPQTLLTFQQTSDFAVTNLRSQWIIAVHRDGQSDEQIVRLTSQGNTESVEFPSGDPTASTQPASSAIETYLSEHKYRDVHAIVRHTDSGIEIDLYAPLPVVETFLEVDRSDPDFVTIDEQRDIIARWSDLVMSRLGLTNNRVRQPMRVIAQAILSPNAAGGTPTESPSTLSAYTARAYLKLTSPITRDSTSFELTWQLFNHCILSTTFLVETPDGFTEKEVSTYAPVIHLRR